MVFGILKADVTFSYFYLQTGITHIHIYFTHIRLLHRKLCMKTVEHLFHRLLDPADFQPFYFPFILASFLSFFFNSCYLLYANVAASAAYLNNEEHRSLLISSSNEKLMTQSRNFGLFFNIFYSMKFFVCLQYLCQKLKVIALSIKMVFYNNVEKTDENERVLCSGTLLIDCTGSMQVQHLLH